MYVKKLSLKILYLEDERGRSITDGSKTRSEREEIGQNLITGV